MNQHEENKSNVIDDKEALNKSQEIKQDKQIFNASVVLENECSASGVDEAVKDQYDEDKKTVNQDDDDWDTL
jgi:hypothetical protein